MEVSQGKFALVQLPIQEQFVNDLLNKPLNARWCGVFKSPGGSFQGVGQQDKARLFGLGLRTRMPEMLHLDSILAFQLFGLFVEISN